MEDRQQPLAQAPPAAVVDARERALGLAQALDLRRAALELIAPAGAASSPEPSRELGLGDRRSARSSAPRARPRSLRRRGRSSRERAAGSVDQANQARFCAHPLLPWLVAVGRAEVQHASARRSSHVRAPRGEHPLHRSQSPKRCAAPASQPPAARAAAHAHRDRGHHVRVALASACARGRRRSRSRPTQLIVSSFQTTAPVSARARRRHARRHSSTARGGRGAAGRRRRATVIHSAPRALERDGCGARRRSAGSFGSSIASTRSSSELAQRPARCRRVQPSHSTITCSVDVRLA